MTRESSNANALNIYCDGGARGNPGPAAIGFLIKDGADRLIYKHSESIGFSTNNTAEYKAVIAALAYLKTRKELVSSSTTIQLFLDSRLVVNQLNGVFKIKDQKMKTLVLAVRNSERELGVLLDEYQTLFASKAPRIRYTLVPRELNQEADALVNRALDQEYASEGISRLG
ncbi:MAG: ribonuclease H [uncultured bacterium]|uniref:RNase H type-1 domain-containing protein n=2 Tax=Candidatus Chisholmiibacteriota TaxID=1817900 RepID=A0A1G1VNM5_9BACT|nr:MAG: ribonuclease H [uncultured bacterium]OGY16827.1 MAG: hypothetical protein A2785_03615 [Candidatus Chisholmbacteria bacterium RIFCSPHIGHO2_01_FULL_49_18]OGY19480.1 MAG: hypothetical protein A3A65_06245 [Candidatus Chisholmbacteria bacterium RIFCSPLOWO2_01_FULL_49_14]